jgi:hypothetical protein
MTNAAAKAEALAADVTTFYAKSVGKPLNWFADFSILVEWSEAIAAALAEALALRDWLGVDHFDAMREECTSYLDLNAAAAA